MSSPRPRYVLDGYNRNRVMIGRCGKMLGSPTHTPPPPSVAAPGTDQVEVDPGVVEVVVEGEVEVELGVFDIAAADARPPDASRCVLLLLSRCE